ncbi:MULTISPECIES: DsbE family thiol:disulfide interchange protein [unclassified Wenzhouxiangella]|uniref:DsbE family thiol:disulfide interchange protein n=1 Tax=unclassified Wenzhouxiangella TaxID=2613841 RepID=UPI000E32C910|nr:MULTISPECIES: DsbE family thiol:disulfide interchange protein [unclassified Wenzhouxiangella]RFF27525.1 DsbE family thiol:disulfide interchange protein [Wenzhouxiangella sp. 15181]RFP69613.1 DsbE family thiol:disulfide interchange protein [Wenzhouxiangella sp. 15190]
MIRMLIPLGVFLALVALLVASLQTGDERKVVQSPLVGKPVPQFSLPGLHDPDTITSRADLLGEPFILNVWGSWCWACRVEHPFVERLGREAPIDLIGFNWKDEREDALEWIGRFGDAWDRHVVDFKGKVAIDLGVYGAPETFLVDHEGIIRHKHVGPIDATVFADLMQRIMELEAQAQ